MNYIFRRSVSGPSKPNRISMTPSEMSKSEMDSSPLLKLNVKCLCKLFEYLSLKELHVIAQTCQRLNVICGAFYLGNYTPSAVCIDDGIVAYRHQSRGVTYGYQLNAFSQYTETIIIPTGSPNQFAYTAEYCGKALRTIRFDGVDLTEIKIKQIKRSLAKIETIEIVDCKLYVYFFDGFLKYCPQLKRLKLRNFEYKTFRVSRGNDWMFHKYPTLEHLELTKCENMIKRSELEVLLELNPNIRSFEIDADMFWENKIVFLESVIKWDDLHIHFQDAKCTRTISIYCMLNTFYKRNHFKRLHLHYEEILNQPFIDQIDTVNAIDTLHLKEEPGSSIPTMINLRELYTFCGNLNMQKTVNNLANLEKIVLWEANIEDVLTIIRHSVKIKEIKIRTLKEKGRFSAEFNEKKYFYQNRLNLVALNHERKNILGACKVQIFVNEDIYIATKWTTGETKHTLVELKRIMLHEWNDIFQE